MKLRSILPALLLLLAPAVLVAQEIKVVPVTYKDGDVTLEGNAVFDASFEETRPGILVVHDWMGPGDYGLRRAKMLAELGYVAFTADIYGQGVRPKNADEAGATAKIYKTDRALFRRRLLAALEQLKKQPSCDPARLAVIGYCFGGTGAIELARAGADLRGAVSFHGGLDSPTPADGKNIKAKLLVLHGAEDPYVPAPDIAAFQKELVDAGVDWQMVYYGGAVHSFSKLETGTDKSTGAAYDAKADARSWRAMQDFFDEIFQ